MCDGTNFGLYALTCDLNLNVDIESDSRNCKAYPLDPIESLDTFWILFGNMTQFQHNSREILMESITPALS